MNGLVLRRSFAVGMLAAQDQLVGLPSRRIWESGYEHG